MKTCIILIAFSAILTSCQPSEPIIALSKDDMVKIVKENDLQFSKGVQTKDSAMLVNIYTNDTQYVIPGRAILKGKIELVKTGVVF